MSNKPHLHELILGLSSKVIPKLEVSAMTQDSRQVVPGSLFCAVRGHHHDGRAYIAKAIENGAVAVLLDVVSDVHAAPVALSDDTNQCRLVHFQTKNADEQGDCDKPKHLSSENIEDSIGKDMCLQQADVHYSVPVIPIVNLAQHLSLIASRFYNEPSKKMKIFGITGTNGKTSISHFLCEMGYKLGFKAALIGTLGYGAPPKLKETGFTTPDAIEVQRILAELYQQGFNWITMEVSSHALEQGRVNAVQFDTAIFTNLTRDHLDYHETMEAYGAAKAKLFNLPFLQKAVINRDDNFGWSLIQSLKNKKITLMSFSTLGKHHEEKHFSEAYVQHAHFNLDGITASVCSPWGSGILKTSLMGGFSLSNLLAVLTACCIQGYSFDEILSHLATLTSVPGRMESYRKNVDKPRVIVDFAHTPDSLKQALIAIREHGAEKIWCVFGCGGDRDSGKRPMMAEMAELYADEIIITNDNPRTEDPLQIVADIKKGLNHPERAVIELDRYRAILHALQSASKDDVVLIAGKGHENYQIVGTEKRTFSDSLTVQVILGEKDL